MSWNIFPLSLTDRNCLSAHKKNRLSVFGSPGVLMWEVFTEGRMPFEQSPNHEVVTLVTQGHRLYRPKMAKPAIYDTMQMCWYEVSKKWEVNSSYEARFL